jgi:putative CocE/NonD family hydrolase
MSSLAELSTGLARKLLALPPRRCKIQQESEWIAMEDGVRLATRRLSPLHGQRVPTVLIRTAYGTRQRLSRDMLLGQLIAEAGYHAVVQDVRGRWDSEGSFTPFANEARDGAATLAWITQQPWCGEGIGLVGSSYSGHAVWAALSAAPVNVNAAVVVMGSADLYPAFHPGGAFSLATALDWATRVGDRETTPRAHIDLERGLRHRQVGEADRVALRRIDWYRDWVDHPRRDAYWEELAAGLPDQAPPSLLIAGWYDCFLDAQLRDYQRLVERAGEQRGVIPRLVVGPWSHGRAAHPRWRGLGRGFLGVSLREILAFLDLHLAGPSTHGEPAPSPALQSVSSPALQSVSSPVLYFMGGGAAKSPSRSSAADWRSAPVWPPPKARGRSLFLRGARVAAERHDGGLSWEPPAVQEEPDSFEADFEDPLPSVGGAFFSSRNRGRGSGAVDQRVLDGRSDLLRYTGEALGSALEIAGSAKLVLHATSDAKNTDFVAKLVDLAPDGSALNLCEGIIRCPWRDAGEGASDTARPGLDTPRALEIDLWACAWRFERGHRIRLEVASASFPRFDRNPGGGDEASETGPASPSATRHTLYHDRERPSHLILPVMGGSHEAQNAKGPPG